MANLAEGAIHKLDPEEILREFSWRRRICRNLNWVAAVWTMVGVWLYYAGIAKPGVRLYQEGLTILIIGIALESTALSVNFAIYCCPVCNQRAGWFPKPLYCRKCGAGLR
jgi:hypothetical protein